MSLARWVGLAGLVIEQTKQAAIGLERDAFSGDV